MSGSSQFYKQDFKHSYTRRARWHDYRAPFIYHIILKKAVTCNIFGEIRGDARIRPSEKGSAYIEKTQLGQIIETAIKRLDKEFPILQIYQYSIMPDHVHLLLRVRQRSEMHLGFYITKLKGKIRQDYSQLIGKQLNSEDIFQSNYCDKILSAKRNLNELFRYIRENPHRLAMRMQYPHFFQRTRRLRIGEYEYEAYGNLFLFRNPDKMPVKISRMTSENTKERMKEQWIENAAMGTVLISPFISKEEKIVRREAESIGANIILIVHEKFTERYKPSARDFDLCSSGRLLIISLGENIGTQLTKEICNRMNALAKEIAQ